MVALSRLLATAGLPPATGGVDPIIARVVHDSREAGPGDLFVAVRGARVDGHDFAAGALAAGAVAVVAERPIAAVGDDVPLALVVDSRAALAPLAARLYGDPSRALLVAGVTGTDGKTTTATMLHAAWQSAGLRAGALTTVDFRNGARIEANSTRQTTLEADDLQWRLKALRDAGCTHIALETSSHGLMLHRVDEVEFAVGVALRITSEHLDFHGSRQSYLEAKAQLIERVAGHPRGLAVLDADDAFAYPRLAAIAVARRLTFSAVGAAAADLRAEAVYAGPRGVRFVARTPWGDSEVRLQLAGRFNAGNALAALGAACATGASLAAAVAGLEGLERVGGRMERVDLGQDFTVVVDYAHTTEALQRVLEELRAATPGRLWVVFGSAGERDLEKRPAMGAVAARLADFLVVTDEDPRGEDRVAILEEIAAGARSAGAVGGERLFLVPDRAEAIATAITRAAAGDTVLCAGKGHESCIFTADGAVPWDERATVEEALRQRLAVARPADPLP